MNWNNMTIFDVCEIYIMSLLKHEKNMIYYTLTLVVDNVTDKNNELASLQFVNIY